MMMILKLDQNLNFFVVVGMYNSLKSTSYLLLFYNFLRHNCDEFLKASCPWCYHLHVYSLQIRNQQQSKYLKTYFLFMKLLPN